MTEAVLQYIWQTQAFNTTALTTVAGEPVTVLKQGLLNTDAGPDFAAARIKINKVEWVGDVEVHVLASAWQQHNHHLDPAYNKVVLHVVWQHDAEAQRQDGTPLPVVELKPLVAKGWLLKYRQLQSSLQAIPCAAFIGQVEAVYKTSAFNKALVERLQRKGGQVLAMLAEFKGDWERVALHLLFEYFGFKKNNAAFKQLAQVTDHRLIRKLASQQQIEAYLLGMAGLLPTGAGGAAYAETLRREFAWLQTKYNFTASPMAPAWWKFMRMRPANFPTIRIAQLAAVLSARPHLFQAIIAASARQAASFFRVKQSEFWQHHYHFGKPAKTSLQGIGEQSARVLSINVAAVLLVAYGTYTQNEAYLERAIAFLEAQKPEQNTIIRRWQQLGIKPDSAAGSQGAIELYNNYCRHQMCLHCPVGHQLLAKG